MRLPHPLLLACLAMLAPAAASACMPQLHDVEGPQLSRGADGAAMWLHDGFQVDGVGPARAIGAGFVLQDALEGNWCRGDQSLIVANCLTGEAVAVGGSFDVMDATIRQEEILAEVEATLVERIRVGHPFSIAGATAMARHLGVDYAVPLRADATIELGGFEVRLEGCRLLHPEMPQAGG